MALPRRTQDGMHGGWSESGLEEKIEKTDPVKLNGANARIVADVDFPFQAIEIAALRSHFFSDIPVATGLVQCDHRPTLLEHKAEWMA